MPQKQKRPSFPFKVPSVIEKYGTDEVTKTKCCVSAEVHEKLVLTS